LWRAGDGFSASAIMAQEAVSLPLHFRRQAGIWALVGLAALLLLSHIDYTI